MLQALGMADREPSGNGDQARNIRRLSPPWSALKVYNTVLLQASAARSDIFHFFLSVFHEWKDYQNLLTIDV